MKCTALGICGPTASITACLTDPTSVTVAPGFRCGAMSAATAPIAPTGTASTTRSASRTASAALSQTVSTKPTSSAAARVSGVLA